MILFANKLLINESRNSWEVSSGTESHHETLHVALFRVGPLTSRRVSFKVAGIRDAWALCWQMVIAGNFRGDIKYLVCISIPGSMGKP